MLKKQYLFLCLTFAAIVAAKANIDNLVGTLSLLTPEHYPDSVLHGAVALEKYWVMHIWDRGWERKKADEAAGEKKDELIKPEKAPALIRVVDQIFHRPPNSAGPANFAPTQSINVLNAKDVAILVGTLVGLSTINDITEQAWNNAKYLYANISKLPATPDVKKMVEILAAKETPESLFETPINDLEKYFQLPIPKQAARLKNLVHSIKNITIFKKSCSALGFGGKDAVIMFQAFAQNLQKTKMVLLALLWYCCRSDKALLQVYYETLNQIVINLQKPQIYNKDTAPQWESWINEKFNDERVPELLKNMKIDTDSPEKAAKMLEDPKFYEWLVYVNLIPGKYPKVSAKQTAALWVNGEPKLASFIDCMDSTIMNFLCILVYNPDKKSFDLNYLTSKFKDLNEKLETFFKSTHPALKKILVSPKTMEEFNVHSAWTDVISNIPGIAYHKKLEDQKVNQASNTSKGFIIAPISMEGYETIEPGKAICYELQPSIKNFIVILNYLLGLHLYEDIYTEILRPDFIKTYLPQLGNKLNVTFAPQYSLEQADNLDFGQTLLTGISFEKSQDPQFNLSTSVRHGELQPIKTEDEDYETKILVGILKNMPYYSQSLPSLSLLRLRILYEWEVRSGDWIKPNKQIVFDLLCLDLINSSILEEVINAIAKNEQTNNPNIAKLLWHFISLQDNSFVQKRLYIKIISTLNIDPELISQAIEAAKTGIGTGNMSEALELFEVLIKQNKGLDEAAEAAKASMKSREKPIVTLNIFKALIEKGKGYQQAIDAAKAGMISGNRHVALAIFKALFKKNQGFDAAVETINDILIGQYDQDAQSKASELLSALFQELKPRLNSYNQQIKEEARAVFKKVHSASKFLPDNQQTLKDNIQSETDKIAAQP